MTGMIRSIPVTPPILTTQWFLSLVTHTHLLLTVYTSPAFHTAAFVPEEYDVCFSVQILVL